MGAYEGVIGFLLNLLPVAVPPCHAASVGAEMFYFPSHRLHHDLSAVPAWLAAVEFRVAANVGTDGTGRDTHSQGDFGAVLPLLEHLMDNFDVLLFQVNTPFEYAFPFMVDLARCPAYSPEDSYGPRGYSPGNICEFVRSFRCRCPVG